MIQPVTLPCKYHFLNVRVQDVYLLKLILDPNVIADNTFNLKSFMTKAHKNPEQTLQIMKGNKGRGKPKEWLSLTHPNTGEEIRAKVLPNPNPNPDQKQR